MEKPTSVRRNFEPVSALSSITFAMAPTPADGVIVPTPNDAREFVCGWGAASINVLSTFPMNKVIFRQQLSGIDSGSAIRQLQKEGLAKLYRGVLPPLLQKTTTLSIMFGMYDKFGKLLTRHYPMMPSTANHATAAMLAGCIEALLTPFERIQTLLQDKKYHQNYRNTLHAFISLRNYGTFEYYRGLTPILFRNGPSNVAFFLLRGKIKQSLPATEKPSADIVKNFVSGGILGAVISTVFFPLNVVKTQMQCRVGGEFIGLFKTFQIVYRERNRSLRELFRGVHINYTRSMISWGIINASYEILKELYRDGSSRS